MTSKRTIEARLSALRKLRVDPRDARPDGLLLPCRAGQALGGVGYDILSVAVPPSGWFHGNIRLYDPRDLIARRYEIWGRAAARERRRRQLERRRKRDLKKAAARRRKTAWEHILKNAQ